MRSTFLIYGTTLAYIMLLNQAYASGFSDILQEIVNNRSPIIVKSTHDPLPKNIAGQDSISTASQQALLRAITAYADVSEKQGVVLLTQEKAAALYQHIEAAEKHSISGRITRADLDLAKARLTQAQADLRDAQAALKAAHLAYRHETGREAAEVEHMPPLPVALPKSEQEVLALAAHHPALLPGTQHTDTRHQIEENALQEWRDFNAASKSISTYAQSIAMAEKELRCVESEHTEGTRSVLELLSAQEEVYSLKIAMLRAKTHYVVRSYRILVATGALSTAVIPANA